MRMNNQLTCIFNSIKGVRRTLNQDRVLVIEGSDYDLFILFDGVSSYPESYQYIIKYTRFLQLKHKQWLSGSGSKFDSLLYEAYQSCLNSNIEGSTTLSSLFIPWREEMARFINIGDSRIYCFSDHYFQKITVDDNIPEMPNILTRWVGQDYLSLHDFHANDIKRDNHFLLCSDGFYSIMENNRTTFLKIFRTESLEEIDREINSLVMDHNSDDASYILIKNASSGRGKHNTNFDILDMT
jgi:serine/threonine protein phosphatase PrpC